MSEFIDSSAIEKFIYIFMALCEIQWVIKLHFSTEKVNHVDKVVDIAVTPRRLSKNSSKLLPFLGTSVFLNYPAHFLRS